MTRTLVLSLAMAFAAASAFAQSLVFIGAPVRMAHDGDMELPRAMLVAGATARTGAGVGFRVTRSSRLTVAAVSFLQVAPAPRRGKALQPYGSLGIAIVNRAGDTRPALDLAGGLLLFFTAHVGAQLDAHYVRGAAAPDGVRTRARSITGGVAIRF